MQHGGLEPSDASVFHVMCRGVGRQIIFEDDADREYLIGRLKAEKRGSGVRIFAWCLMDNHVHLLICAEQSELSAFMRRVLSDYAIHFNRCHDRVGHLFQDRYLRKPVDTEAYLLGTVRYIHHNPIEAGFVNFATYRWSSCRDYLGEGDSAITDPEEVMDLFGSLEEFVRFHGETDQTAYPDIQTSRANVALARALFIAIDEIGEERLHSAKSLPRNERDCLVARLLARGLSVRQIERLTGISRGVISRISAQEKADKMPTG